MHTSVIYCNTETLAVIRTQRRVWANLRRSAIGDLNFALMAVLLAALLALLAAGAHAVAALSVTAGGPGYAASLGYMEGFYAPNFPMPTTAITVEFWTKLLPVGMRWATS